MSTDKTWQNEHSKVLIDAGWTLHLINPERSHGYVVHQTTGQIVYIEFEDETLDDDDRKWEAITALITKHLRFDLNFQFRQING